MIFLHFFVIILLYLIYSSSEQWNFGKGARGMYYNDYNRTPEERPIYTNDYRVEEVRPPKKKKHTGVKIAAACLACTVLGGAIVGGVGLATGYLFPEKTTIYESNRTPTVVNMAKVDGQTVLTMEQVYENNLASVVGVNGDVQTNYWNQVVTNAVAGSGFVITEDGYILTNYHVIDGVDDLKVTFADGKSYDAELVGGEEANDIAVLKINATGLTPVVVGNSDNMKVGQQVAAIGNPLGELTFTMTEGIVSALDRNIKMDNSNTINVLQTNAAINSGNSGGPLFNMYGECIGITNAKYSNNGSSDASIEGIGFAIPINDVKDMVTSIIEKGYVSGKPNVGILMDDVSSDAVQRYGIPAGAYIPAVLEGSCADKAGIQEGDIITAVNGKETPDSSTLKNTVKDFKAGDTVTFSVYRNGKTQEISLTLDEYDQDREKEMADLQEEYKQQNQRAQQQQQNNPYDYFWPFGGFSW